MKTWRVKMADIAVVIAALFLIPLFLVSGAQAQKYGKYLVDGEKLSRQEQYVLAQTEKGETADLLAKFVLPRIPDQDRREQIRKLGLAAYVEQLNDKDSKAFLKKYGERLLLIRPRFLELLLIKGFGFPGFKIHWHGVMIANAFIKAPLDFEGAEVEHSFGLENSILQGGAIFRGSWFKKDLFLSRTKFQEDANFDRVKIGKSLFVRGAHFYGLVIFVIADIGANFEADGAQFLNAKAEANFNGMKAGNIAFFKGANFQGPVNFDLADIKGNFEADGAEFHYTDTYDSSIHHLNTFASIKIGNLGLFRDVIFNGEMDFGYGNFLDLLIQGRDPSGGNEPAKLNLAGLMVQRDLKISNMKIGALKAPNCQVKGTATFAKVKWPGKDKVNLAGLSCQSMKMPEPPPTYWWDKVTTWLLKWLYPHHALLSWIDNGDCDATTYLNLEAFFQRTGEKDFADQAYIKMKQKESGLDIWRGWLNPCKWPKILFWDLPVGYGRKPLRILVFALLFIGVGACFFNPLYLTKVKWPKRNKFFGLLGRLALSCDICTPSLLNLGLEQDWSPPGVPCE